MRKVFLLAFALFAWNILANAQESDERYIEVTGSSEIEVVPDEIHFLIQIKEYWEEEYTGKERGRFSDESAVDCDRERFA